MEVPFLPTVLDSLAEGVFTVDRDWKITSFNRAAEELGIHKTTLWRKIKKYGIENESNGPFAWPPN